MYKKIRKRIVILWEYYSHGHRLTFNSVFPPRKKIYSSVSLFLFDFTLRLMIATVEVGHKLFLVTFWGKPFRARVYISQWGIGPSRLAVQDPVGGVSFHFSPKGRPTTRQRQSFLSFSHCSSALTSGRKVESAAVETWEEPATPLALGIQCCALQRRSDRSPRARAPAPPGGVAGESGTHTGHGTRTV
jgi:hypothetical protein